MKKTKVLCLLCALMLILVMVCLVACDTADTSKSGNQVKACEHSWENATCTTPKTCKLCNETEGEARDHTWMSATCTEPKTCKECDTTTGAALGHTEVVDAAVAPTCTVVGKTEGKHCSVCNEVLIAQNDVAALGHTEVVDAGVDATCTTAGKTEGKHCSVCNEVLVAQSVVAVLDHDWKTATCTAPKTCKRCNLTTGSALGHSWQNATCTSAKRCSSCGTTTGSALGHNWQSATCTSPKKCTRCYATTGSASGHSYSNYRCTKCGVSQIKYYSGTRAPDFGCLFPTYISPTLVSGTMYAYDYSAIEKQDSEWDCIYGYHYMLNYCGYRYSNSFKDDDGNTVLVYYDSSYNYVMFSANDQLNVIVVMTG